MPATVVSSSPQRGSPARTTNLAGPNAGSGGDGFLLSGQRMARNGASSGSELAQTAVGSIVGRAGGSVVTTEALSGTFQMLLDDKWDGLRRVATQLSEAMAAEVVAVAHVCGQLQGLCGRFPSSSADDDESGIPSVGARLQPGAELAEHLALSVAEVRTITRDTLFRLEATARDANRDRQASERRAEQTQARCQLLHKEVAALRHELDTLRREELRRGRRAVVAQSKGPTASDALDVAASGDLPTSDEVCRLRKEVVDLREQLVVYEANALEQAADMAAALKAAASNQTAMLKLDESRTELEALAAKHTAQSKAFEVHRAEMLHEFEGLVAHATRTKRQRDDARRLALQGSALSAGVSLAARVFHAWAHAARHKLRDEKLATFQSRNDSGARSLSAAEGELAALKLKHHRTVEQMQEELDRRRNAIARLETANATLQADVQRLGRLVGGGGGGGGALTASSSAIPSGAGSPVALSFGVPATDARGGNGASVGDAQHIEALEAYNLLFKSLRTCRDRLKLRCLSVPPLQMHENTTASVTGLVVSWLKAVAGGFSRLFALEARVGKLRTRLVTISVATRAKVAALAVKLSLPIGTLEGQVVRSKKEKYEELITRIASLRSKIETVRETLARTFDTKDPAPSVALVDGLDADIAVFLRVLKGVEAAQFAMSLQLTKARVDEAVKSRTHGVNAPQQEEQEQAARNAPPPSTSNPEVLRSSKRLLEDLRSASAPPGASASAPLGGRHGALVPLEDHAYGSVVWSQGHADMINGKVRTIAPKGGPDLSAAGPAAASLRRRQLTRNADVARGSSQRIVTQPNGFAARGAAVIPFREHKGPTRPADVPRQRVRLADDLLK